MTTRHDSPAPATPKATRSRWAAIGAAIAVSIGAGGGFGLASAATDGGGAGYSAVTPCRLIDTRAGDNNVGPRSTPLGAAESDTFAARGAQGQCSATQLPSNATALALNVTAVRASEQTFVTFWPGGTKPNSSSLNPAPGAPPTPNAVITQLSDTGSFNVFNNAGNVGLIVDVVGYFTEIDLGEFVTDADLESLVTESEQLLAFDDFLGLLTGTNGPVKVNTRDIQANENHIERQQTVAAGRHDFHPVRQDGDRDIDQGVFVPAGAPNNELWATVDLPQGAQVTGLRARMIDNTFGASLGVQLFQVAETGGASAVTAEISTVADSNSPAVRGYETIAASSNNEDTFSYEIRARVDQGVFWSTAGIQDNLQVVGVFVDYTMEVEPVL